MPFQLVHLMGWIAAPVTTFSAYIILGFHAIGNEIENPFGPEVNDLPMELYCANIASDIAIITSKPAFKPPDIVQHADNKPLYPISSAGSAFWLDSDKTIIQEALRTRAGLCKEAVWKRQCSVATASDAEKTLSRTSTACDEEAGEAGISDTASTRRRDFAAR